MSFVRCQIGQWQLRLAKGLQALLWRSKVEEFYHGLRPLALGLWVHAGFGKERLHRCVVMITGAEHTLRAFGLGRILLLQKALK